MTDRQALGAGGPPFANHHSNSFTAERYDSAAHLRADDVPTPPHNSDAPTPTGKEDYAFSPGRGLVPTNPKKRRALFIGVPVAVVLIAAIVVGVVVGVTRKHSGSGSSSAGSGGSTSQDPNAGSPTATDASGAVPTIVASEGQGGDGSTVKTDAGAEFTYQNSFGGFWAQDPNNPYSVGTQVLASIIIFGKAEHS